MTFVKRFLVAVVMTFSMAVMTTYSSSAASPFLLNSLRIFRYRFTFLDRVNTMTTAGMFQNNIKIPTLSSRP